MIPGKTLRNYKQNEGEYRDRHHHFVCIQCGLTQDFFSDKLDKLTLPESLQSIGHVETTQVEVKGICRKCAAKEKKI